jgi:hypothetical protein
MTDVPKHERQAVAAALREVLATRAMTLLAEGEKPPPGATVVTLRELWTGVPDQPENRQPPKAV